MVKQQRRYLFALVLLSAWAAVVLGYVYRAGAAPTVVLLLFLPLGPMLWFLWRLHRRAMAPKLRQIHWLAGEVEACIRENRRTLPSASAPAEIRPLIQSLNRLLEFENRRFEQERNFTADASHELRTPLAGIRLQADLALRSDDAGQRLNALKNIIKAVDRATRLVDQLLTLARLTDEELDVILHPVDLNRVCERAVAGHYEPAGARAIDLRLEKPEVAVTIDGDAASLLIMLDNLLRNALTYTPEGGRVEVRLGAGKGVAHLSVTDSGPGIRADQRTRVLKRFQKAEGARESGIGIGLAIVHRIIQLHGGDITLADAQWGAGLSVRIDLPLAETAAGDGA